ncbi:MAG: hypothetical protein ABSC51_10185 [Gaiellaceae bacterium]|jgi:hypothetical protein
MGYELGYEITWGGDPEDACVTTWGTASIEGLDAWIQEGLSDPRYRPGMHVLIDHRQLDWSGLSSEDVHERVALFARDAVRLDSARAAVVMRSPVEFGMARMEATYIDLEPELGIAIRIFFSIEDAREWLRERIAADDDSADLTK